MAIHQSFSEQVTAAMVQRSPVFEVCVDFSRSMFTSFVAEKIYSAIMMMMDAPLRLRVNLIKLLISGYISSSLFIVLHVASDHRDMYLIAYDH